MKKLAKLVTIAAIVSFVVYALSAFNDAAQVGRTAQQTSTTNAAISAALGR